MSDDLTPDPEALQRMIANDDAIAALRSLAEAVVVIRRVLVEGGFPDEAANEMAIRAWRQFFPGTNPLGLLLGGPPA